jgi:hypothetical protein
MLLVTRRLATGLLLVPSAASVLPARRRRDRAGHVHPGQRHLLDGRRADARRPPLRRVFACLAAVVKAERAKASAAGGHAIFAHAGDTLSPSLISGIDHGARIMTLTNLIAPDIFAPGNHEYDFGKATFLELMGEAKFPLYAANLRGPDGRPLPGFKDRSMVTIGGVRIGLVGATYDDSARASDPGDLKFLPTVATLSEQAAALPRGRRLRRRRGASRANRVTRSSRPRDRSHSHRPHPRSVHQL